MNTPEALKKQRDYIAKYSRPEIKGVMVFFRVDNRYETYNECADALCDICGCDRPKDFGCTRIASFLSHRLDEMLTKVIHANYRLVIDEMN